MEKKFKCKNCSKISLIVRKNVSKRTKEVLGWACPKHYWVFKNKPCCEKPDMDLKFNKKEIRGENKCQIKKIMQ